MAVTIHAVGRTDVPPCAASERFRHEITYFMSVPGEGGIPPLPPGEYWVRLSDAKQWLDDGTFEVVSPLECGIGIENFNDVKVGDRIEAFEVEQTPDTL